MRYRFCFLGILFSVLVVFSPGCEDGSDVDFSSGGSSRPEGLVQARVNEDGMVQIAMVMAPKAPGGKAPDVSELRGVNLFDRNVIPPADSPDSQVRARAHTDRRIGFGGNLNFSAVRRTLDQFALVPFFGDEELGNGIVNDENFTLDHVICYASSRYLAYDHYVDFDQLPTGRQKITFRHNELEGSAEVYKESGFIWAKINDNPPAIVRSLNGQDPRVANVAFILPLNSALTPRGMSDEILKETVGVWTVEGEPQFSDRGFDSDVLMWGQEGAGATPFSFNLKALLVENVEAEYAEDTTDPDTGEVLSNGATFTADLKFIEGKPEGQTNTTSQRFEALHRATAYKAEIFEDGGEVVRTLWGHAPVPGAGVTTLTIPWNGESNLGNKVPGNTVYGIAITAMLDDTESPPEQANGYIFTISPGVGPEGVSAPFLGDEELKITPAGYYPYTDEEINNYEETEEGELVWLGRDEFGNPLGPDHDGDGESDFEPGDGPPEVEFSADLFKPGYKTSWTLRVFKGPEDDRVEITESYYGNNPIDELTPPWTGEGDLFETWVPPGNLGGEEITLQLSVERCRDQPDLQILAMFRGTPDPTATPPTAGCPVEVCEFAMGPVVNISDIRFGGAADATRNESGPYKVYDYINDVDPNDKLQWIKGQNDAEDEMVPVVMKQGERLYAKASFQGTGSGARALRATVKFKNGQTVGPITATNLNQTSLGDPFGFGATGIVSFSLPQGVGRHIVKIDWELDLAQGLGTLTRTQSTPGGEGHMIYTVLGDIPTDTPIESADPTKPELAYIWYHGDTFTADTPSNTPGQRSPLDLATTWASGLSETNAIVETIVKGLWDEGGYLLSDSAISWDPLGNIVLRTILEAPEIGLEDTCGLLKLYSSYVGAQAYQVSLKTPDRREAFSNYVNGLGQTDQVSSVTSIIYYGSASFLRQPTGIPFTFPTFRRAFAPLIYNISIGNKNRFNWAQYATRTHRVVGVGPPSEQRESMMLIDPSWRVDSRSNLNVTNPNFTFNQLNQHDITSFQIAFSQRFPSQPVPPPSENYRDAVQIREAKEQRVMGVDDHLSEYWYLYDSTNLRRTHGYNNQSDDLFNLTIRGTKVTQ